MRPVSPLDHAVAVSVGRSFGNRPAVRLEVGGTSFEVALLRPRLRRWDHIKGRWERTQYTPLLGFTVGR